MLTTATREEYVGHQLEAAIRERTMNRRWHRHHRRSDHSAACRMGDLERENNLVLRELFRIRRDALRLHRAEQARVKAAFHTTFAPSWTEAEARWAWGNR